MESLRNKKIELKKEQVIELEKQPESGMGYHIVDILLKDGSLLENKIILNCQYLQLDMEESINVDNIISIIVKRK